VALRPIVPWAEAEGPYEEWWWIQQSVPCIKTACRTPTEGTWKWAKLLQNWESWGRWIFLLGGSSVVYKLVYTSVVVSGVSRVNPCITGVFTNLLSGWTTKYSWVKKQPNLEVAHVYEHLGYPPIGFNPWTQLSHGQKLDKKRHIGGWSYHH
jgi:hypothetical protein